ncbi:MAG: sensor histidine kinase [Coraliomargaritaceae bacterium]
MIRKSFICFSVLLQSVLGFLLLSVVPAFAVEEKSISEIADIRALAKANDLNQSAVTVRGQVIHVRFRGDGFFLFDGTNGIFVELKIPAKYQLPVQVGDMVEVKGSISKEKFYPSIVFESLIHLGTAPLPEARIFYSYELYLTSMDSAWVSVRGRLVSMSVDPAYGAIILGVEMNSVKLTVQIKYTAENYKALSNRMFRLVSFEAVAATIHNPNQQLTGRIFFANEASDFKILDDYLTEFEDLPHYESHELARMGILLRQLVSTSGVVTHAEGNRIYLRGPVSSLLAVARDNNTIKPGDHVLLRGTAWPQSVSPIFQTIELEIEAGEALPEPVDVLLGDEIDPDLNYELVRLDARCLDIGKSFNLSSLSFDGQERISLLCRSGPHLFEAYLPKDFDSNSIEVGSLLQLTGICQLTADPRARWKLLVEGFSLQVRSADDIVIIKSAPFWTMERFIAVLGTLLAVLFLFLVWVILLRRTVDKQTSLIGKQVERQTIMDERQRMARELHDNLEQGLAGMAIQLRGALKLQKRHSENADASIRKFMETSDADLNGAKKDYEEQLAELETSSNQSQRALLTVQDMLLHCSEESRASIMDLRAGLLERMDLPTALEVALEPLADATKAKLVIERSGRVFRLISEAERHVFLIIREAVSNALRHGQPSSVRVCLKYSNTELCVNVEDDGHGFDLSKDKTPGHFGLVGMRERAGYLNGIIEIRSEVGSGTRIQLLVPEIDNWRRD